MPFFAGAALAAGCLLLPCGLAMPFAVGAAAAAPFAAALPAQTANKIKLQ